MDDPVVFRSRDGFPLLGYRTDLQEGQAKLLNLAEGPTARPQGSLSIASKGKSTGDTVPWEWSLTVPLVYFDLRFFSKKNLFNSFEIGTFQTEKATKTTILIFCRLILILNPRRTYLAFVSYMRLVYLTQTFLNRFSPNFTRTSSDHTDYCLLNQEPVKLTTQRCQGTRQGEDQGRPGSRVWKKHWRPTTSHPPRPSNLPQTESSFSPRRQGSYKRTDKVK